MTQVFLWTGFIALMGLAVFAAAWAWDRAIRKVLDATRSFYWVLAFVMYRKKGASHFMTKRHLVNAIVMEDPDGEAGMWLIKEVRSRKQQRTQQEQP